jgi:hypothetical protein
MAFLILDPTIARAAKCLPVPTAIASPGIASGAQDGELLTVNREL